MSVTLYYYDEATDEGFVYDTDLEEFLDSADDNKIIDIYKEIKDADEFDKSVLEDNDLTGEESDEELLKRVTTLRNVLDDLTDKYKIVNVIEDEILEYYANTAREEYEENKLADRDPYSYNGVSRSDFF